VSFGNRVFAEDLHMPSNNHKQAARQVFEEVFNRADFEVANDLFTDDFIAHAFPDLRGPEGVRTIVTGFRNGFSDIEWTIEHLFGEGAYIAVRWTARGTHDGEFRGHEPTGTTVEIPGTTILRVDNDRVAEGWTIFDALGLFEQIGAIDTSGG
jgi:predicted ester cyclase